MEAAKLAWREEARTLECPSVSGLLARPPRGSVVRRKRGRDSAGVPCSPGTCRPVLDFSCAAPSRGPHSHVAGSQGHRPVGRAPLPTPTVTAGPVRGLHTELRGAVACVSAQSSQCSTRGPHSGSFCSAGASPPLRARRVPGQNEIIPARPALSASSGHPSGPPFPTSNVLVIHQRR